MISLLYASGLDIKFGFCPGLFILVVCAIAHAACDDASIENIKEIYASLISKASVTQISTCIFKTLWIIPVEVVLQGHNLKFV